MTDVPVGGACFFDAALSSALLRLLLLLSFHPPFDILLLIRPCISPVYLVPHHQHILLSIVLYLGLLSVCLSLFLLPPPVPWRGVPDHRAHSTHDLSVLESTDTDHGEGRGRSYYWSAPD